MFTGIVEERGSVLEAGTSRLVIACRTVVTDSDIGAIQGSCQLTQRSGLAS